MKHRQGLTQQGFTLIELMIALVLGAFLMAGVYSYYIGQFKTNIAQENVLEMQQNLRSVLYLISKDIRRAGLDPDDTGSIGFTAANSSSMTFTYVDSGSTTTIRYYRSDSNNDGEYEICRQLNNDNDDVEIIAENIEELEFYYQLANGTETLNPDSSVLSQIRKVQVSVLSRASSAETGIDSADSYTAGSGTVWGNLDAGYRRRYLSVSVCCRNVGI